MEKNIKTRYALIDGLRGLTIASMVCYHAVWDLINIFDFIEDDGWETVLFIWQQSICWSFIFCRDFAVPWDGELYSAVCRCFSAVPSSRRQLLFLCRKILFYSVS